MKSHGGLMQAPWRPHEVPWRPHAGHMDAPSARSPPKFPLRTLGGQVSKRPGRSPFTLALVEFVRFFLSGVVVDGEGNYPTDSVEMF